jgi:hypothetical protein
LGDHGGRRRPARAKLEERLVIASKIAAVMLLVVLVLAGFAGYSELQFRKLSDALDADIATYGRLRWDRPVLHGQAGEGNAAFEAQQVLQGFLGLTPELREALALRLHYGQPLSPELTALLDKHKELVAKLRAATRLSWAMNEIAVVQGAKAAAPPYPRALDAAMLMLGEASRSAPDECLASSADAIRFGQDLVPGAPLEAASVSMRITSVAAPVVTRCAAAATPDGLARAVRDFSALAGHAPPTGTAIELADILARVELRKLATVVDAEGDDSLLTRLRRRPTLFAAFAYFDNPTRWRELTPAQYPQALDTWQKEQAWRARSEMPLVTKASADVDGWLHDDMRGQALLRALTVGLGTLAERARRKKIPREPTGLADPTLRDPFNGSPLKWRITGEGIELAVWSVGEDRRDDKGSSDWTSQAPVDVVVHFSLRLPTEPAPAKRAAPSAAR